jgi:5,10-methenyltetrahydrofolate synthetase
MTKKVLRKLFKEKRSQLTLAQRKIASSHIFGHLAEHFKWENKVISIFLPIARLNELETAPIIEFLAKKNTLALPFTMLEQLAMGHRKLSDDTIITNNEWGIPEPQNGEIIHPALLDVIFIPLLISDEKGYRVGYGKGFYDRFMKRPFDFFTSLVALIILSPLLVVVAVLIIIKIGSPILFIQERPGKDEKIFKLYKFRTMTNKKDSQGRLLPDKDRLTAFGKFLRKTSIDELPELFNILKGDMSFVGPRPALYNQDDLVAEREKHGVHQVLPCVTGWAQVNGRDTLPIPETAKLDGEYIKHFSLWTDFKLLLKTLVAIIKRDLKSVV